MIHKCMYVAISDCMNLKNTSLGSHLMIQCWYKFSWICSKQTDLILRLTVPLLGNYSVNTFPRKRKRNNRTSVARQRISKKAFSTIERLYFLRSPWRGVIKGQRRSFESVVFENWVEFWRWQSKVIEKKWYEMNETVQRRLHVWFEVTVRLLQICCQDMTSEGWKTLCVCNDELWSVKINDSAVLPVVPNCECIRCNKSNHTIQNYVYCH
jgi:hypothetical protein